MFLKRSTINIALLRSEELPQSNYNAILKRHSSQQAPDQGRGDSRRFITDRY